MPPNGRGDPAHYTFISEPAQFYFPRFGKNDRRHAVPNPIAHLLLSRVLADNFVDLTKSARQSLISLSPLVLDWSGPRALVRPTIDALDDFRINLASRREKYAAADIHAFFHSIYTHAIPWAIHGKTFAKRNRRPIHYGNLIDLLCRNAQDGQTIGLPVGPDTSRLIAEVVASAIDDILQKKLGVGARDASRYIDDYTLSSPADHTGEAMLAAVRQAAAHFELELNNDKSSIHSTALRPAKGWQRAAHAYIPRPAGPAGAVDAGEIEHFLYQLGRLCLAHPDLNIEKFGLQNARSALVAVDSWQPLQFALISAYRRNSSLVSLLVEVCLLRQISHHDVQSDVLIEFIENRLPVLASGNRTGEIIWLLFMAARLRLPLSAAKLKPLYAMENGFVALLVALLDRRGLVNGAIDRRLWDTSLNQDGLRGPMWLYAYEAVGAGLLPGASDAFILSDPYFSLLHSKKIRFLDIDRGYSSVTSVLRGLRQENERLRRLREALQRAEPLDWDDDEAEEDDENPFEGLY